MNKRNIKESRDELSLALTNFMEDSFVPNLGNDRMFDGENKWIISEDEQDAILTLLDMLKDCGCLEDLKNKK